jgi:superfamily II DNA or RNA helicase
MKGAAFEPGTVVRLKHDPSCAGKITGDTRDQAGRIYWGVRMADGSGVRMLPEAQLVSEVAEPDPLADLASGRFGQPEALRRLLLHHRLTGRLRDVIYSMDVTDTEFHAYQFKPVLKLLASPSQGLLIADEVGLGKTIEAGLIWTELVARFDCHRLLVVCPKSLIEKWRLELWQKFSVDAKIVDAAELFHCLQREGERSDGFALIASLPSVRPNRDWEEEGDGSRAKLMRFLSAREGQEPLVDCLVFDEAHHLRNAETMSHAFARKAMDVADYKLLLSATPINLHSEDLRNLLRLLDPETFENAHMFDTLAEENRPLVAARELALNSRTGFDELLSAVRNLPRGQVLKIDNQLDKLIEQLADPEIVDSKAIRNRIAAQLEEMSLLGSTVNRTRRRDVNALKVERRVNHLRWHMSDTEERFYRDMSDIVREHAWSLNAGELFLLATPQRLIASSLPAACGHWARHAGDLSLDDPDESGEIAGSLVAKLAEACGDSSLLVALEAEDGKLEILGEALDQHWALDPAEKLIVFSSFRITLDYLARRLQEKGIAVELMHGGIKEDRTSILTRFEAQDGPRVLLTSEVGGEGLDIQFCRSLINYDLPWNPMKVEQRIGRIDRIGQQSPAVSVISLICAGTIEERIYDRLYRRLLTIEQTLGAFEAILGAEIAKLEHVLLDPKLTAQEHEAEIDRQAFALIERERQTRALEEEAPGLIAHGDMILDQIEENHRPERQVSGTELADYIHQALSARYPGTRVDDVPGEPGMHEVVLSAAAHYALKQMLTRGARARTRLNRETRIRAVFERVAGLPKSVERITSVHPLTSLAKGVRTEAAHAAAMKPVVCLAVDPDHVGLPVGTYVAAVERWLVDGAVPVARLAHAAGEVSGAILDPRDAEQLLQSALRFGRTCRSSIPSAATVAAAVRLIEEPLARSFDQFVGEEAARHEDRAATGLARIEQQRLKRVRDLEWKLSEWKRSGDPKKLRLIPAEQGKLDKLIARLDHRRDQLLAAQDRFSFQQDLLGLAIVRVGAGQ